MKQKVWYVQKSNIETEKAEDSLGEAIKGIQREQGVRVFRYINCILNR